MVKKIPLALSACLLATACATLPDVTIGYYPVQADTFLTATQTISCSEDGSSIMSATTVDQNTIYSADPTAGRKHYFRFARMNSKFGDTDLTFKLTEDGRLAGVNTTTEGQGQAILKSAVDVATALSTAAGDAGGAGGAKPLVATPDQKPPPAAEDKSCVGTKFLQRGKSATIKYVKHIVPSGYATATGPMPLAEGYASTAGKLAGIAVAPTLTVSLQDSLLDLNGDKGNQACRASGTDSADGSHSDDPDTLCLQKMQSAAIRVTTKDTTVFAKNIAVPSGPAIIPVEIPKSAIFGKETTALALADSGAITSIGYSKTTGAAAALGAVAGIITFGATR